MLDMLGMLLRDYALLLLTSWQTALAGMLAFGVGLAVVGRTSTPSLFGALLQPLRILLVATLAFPMLLLLVGIGYARILAADYTSIGVGIGVGVVTYLLWRGTIISQERK